MIDASRPFIVVGNPILNLQGTSGLLPVCVHVLLLLCDGNEGVTGHYSVRHVVCGFVTYPNHKQPSMTISAFLVLQAGCLRLSLT